MTERQSQLTPAQQAARDWIRAQARIRIEQSLPEQSVAYEFLKELEDRAWATLTVGDVAPDGSVFAGATPDGRSQVFAMPTDLSVTVTFNDAAKAVAKLNATKALGHHDWQIPTLEQLKLLQRNKDKGAFKDTFETRLSSGSGYPFWYWSSTQHPDFSSNVYNVRFSDGYQLWDRKDDNRLSCRPVRLVAATAAPAPG